MKPKSLFVSYASGDRDVASHVVSFFESRGQQCWIAPRDILPSADWAESIIDGIDSSSGMVLLLSRYSNESPQVRRELERAVDRGIPIYPLFLESIELSKWMQYYISAHQWNDASDVSLDTRLTELFRAVTASCSAGEPPPDFAALSSMVADDLASLSAELDASGGDSERLLPGERRKVTVLHIVAEISDREAFSSVRMAVQKTVVNLVEKFTEFYGGYLEGLSLSGFRCVFGLETVREDDADRALSCAVGLLGGFHELDSLLHARNLSVSFGLGIASGMVWVDDQELIAHGEVLLSAREMAETVSGSLLATEAFSRGLRGQYSWVEHSTGVCLLTDLPDTPTGSRILSILTPFVGREEEFARLDSLLQRQRSGGEHILMAIWGEAGIGKSRLVHEFISRRCCEDCRVLRGQTLSFAQPPYWVWTTLLQDLLVIQPGSVVVYEEFLQRLGGSPALADSAPFLARLLSIPCNDSRLENLDEKGIRLETKIAFRNLFESLSEKNRLVVVLEDFHWMEESDRQILRFLAENCTTEFPIVFLLVSRPEGKDGKGVRFDVNSTLAVYESMELGEVDEPASVDLIRRLLETISDKKVSRFPEEVRSFLLSRSGGNPFFLEELIFDLVERGVLMEGEKEWGLRVPAGGLFVPDSLVGLIQSRLERLPDSWRGVLQNASVLGVEFQLKLYWKLVNRLYLARCHLDVFDGLEQKQMLHRKIAAFDKMYAFRHILVHDTAYSSILKENLKKLHKAAAESLREMYAGGLDRIAGILTHHYDRAGEFDAAIEWGLRALNNYYGEEALGLSVRLEELLEETKSGEELDEGIFKLLSYREKTQNILADREEQRKTIQRMQDIAERTGSDRFKAIALKKQGALDMVTTGIEEGRVNLERALEYARKAKDRAFEGIVLGNLGSLDTNQMRTESARQFFEQALEIHREVGDLRSQGIILMNLGILHKQHCAWQEARNHYEMALDIAERVGDRRSEADILANMGTLLLTMGYPDSAEEYYLRSIPKQKETGNRRSSGILLCNIAILQMNLGHYAKARENYLEALTVIREVGDVRLEGYILSNLGILYSDQGMFEEAMEHYEKALEIHLQTGNRSMEALTLSNIGNIHRERGDFSQARKSYVKAAGILRELKSRDNLAGILANIGCLNLLEGDGEAAEALFRQSYETVMELKMGNNNLDGFTDLYEKLSAGGYEVPWPSHWEPREEPDSPPSGKRS